MKKLDYVLCVLLGLFIGVAYVSYNQLQMFKESKSDPAAEYDAHVQLLVTLDHLYREHGFELLNGPRLIMLNDSMKIMQGSFIRAGVPSEMRMGMIEDYRGRGFLFGGASRILALKVDQSVCEQSGTKLEGMMQALEFTVQQSGTFVACMAYDYKEHSNSAMLKAYGSDLIEYFLITKVDFLPPAKINQKKRKIIQDSV